MQENTSKKKPNEIVKIAEQSARQRRILEARKQAKRERQSDKHIVTHLASGNA
jgi:hypothetical protein